MGKRLNRLARELRRDYPDCRTKVYVDTGPVLERELAARAGLGVVGKNTCLLSREGSWFLLGEVFLSFELQPDEPLTDLCGRCTRCLDACPTGALTEPFRLDSNRCISYWTIEHRGPVPREMRPGLEDWVFGCDICQDVCPWNLRPAVPAEQPDFHLPAHRGELNLLSLLTLEAEEYRQRFQGSAMQRARLEGLKRNAATAMGHRGEGRYVPALAAALDNEAEDLAVRCHAAWALGRIGDAAALLALRRASARTHLPELQREVELALEEAETAERAPASGAPAPAS
jgi:epoxyqueuosine reductase